MSPLSCEDSSKLLLLGVISLFNSLCEHPSTVHVLSFHPHPSSFPSLAAPPLSCSHTHSLLLLHFVSLPPFFPYAPSSLPCTLSLTHSTAPSLPPFLPLPLTPSHPPSLPYPLPLQVNASDDASSRPSSGLGAVHLEVPPLGKFRAASFNSETSESSSARSLARYRRMCVAGELQSSTSVCSALSLLLQCYIMYMEHIDNVFCSGLCYLHVRVLVSLKQCLF